jgi:low affinity Fe/Cu permease
MKSDTHNKGLFCRFSQKTAQLAGHPVTFGIALIAVIVWAISGPVFGFSDTWQLVINTSTTIITFLMVFLIQNTQNTDTHAMQLKLDELIRATKGAHTVLLDLEELSEEELSSIRDEYEKIAAQARRKLAKGQSDAGNPRVDLNMAKQIK